jgi:hypothetical protein
MFCLQFWLLWREIEHVEFFFSEDDYLDSAHRSNDNATSSATSRSAPGASSTKVEVKTPELEINTSASVGTSTSLLPDQPSARKRPRRSAASAAPSYVVPDSDDEAIAEDSIDYEYHSDRKGKGKAKAESSLQIWIKHLTALLKEEEKKVE